MATGMVTDPLPSPLSSPRRARGPRPAIRGTLPCCHGQPSRRRNTQPARTIHNAESGRRIRLCWFESVNTDSPLCPAPALY